MRLEGKILISHPNCPQDNFFHKAVIYIYQDRLSQGTIGVILNKPSQFTLKEICKEKKLNLIGGNSIVYHGGPVQQNALVLLHSQEWKSENTAKAGEKLFISSDTIMLQRLALGDTPIFWKLFGGFSGWAPGQLEAELNGSWPYRPENSWLIAEPNLSLLFETHHDKIWKQAFDMSSHQMFDQYF